MADAWPMIARCKWRQWEGLTELERLDAESCWNMPRGVAPMIPYQDSDYPEREYILWCVDHDPMPLHLMMVKEFTPPRTL